MRSFCVMFVPDEEGPDDVGHHAEPQGSQYSELKEKIIHKYRVSKILHEIDKIPEGFQYSP
jgi:hypothetical protein